MQLTCPRCCRGLKEVDGVDQCAHCGGIWFDRGELEYTVAASQREPVVPSAPVESDVRYLPCPRCQTVMTRRAYRQVSGVVLDECHLHGRWADKGEVDRIVAFEESSGPERLIRKEADDRRLAKERARTSRAKWQRIRLGLESC